MNQWHEHTNLIMSNANDILNQALGLPLADRAWLARDLLASLECDDFDEDAEASWVSEIEARSDAVARGEFTAADWRESMDRIRDELAKRRTR